MVLQHSDVGSIPTSRVARNTLQLDYSLRNGFKPIVIVTYIIDEQLSWFLPFYPVFACCYWPLWECFLVMSRCHGFEGDRPDLL